MANVLGQMSFSDAAYEVLKSGKRPLTPTDIAQEAIKKGLLRTNSKRPGATMAARLRSDKRFVSAGSGKWTLKEGI